MTQYLHDLNLNDEVLVQKHEGGLNYVGKNKFYFKDYNITKSF